MEKLSIEQIKSIYIGVLKLGRNIKVVDDKITLYFVVYKHYQEWVIENNTWIQTKFIRVK